MRMRLIALMMVVLLFTPCVAWGKQRVERLKERQPYEVAFSWGGNATFWVIVHRTASLGGYSGPALAESFAKILQEIMQQRSVQVSGIERITDRRAFVDKLREEGRTLRLFAVLYNGDRLHVYGNLVPLDGNGKTSTILPYFEIHTAGAYTSQATFVADLKAKLATTINTRINRILTDLQGKGTKPTSLPGWKNAQ